MPAFGFKDQFVSKIMDGTKVTTFRRTKRCNPGDIMKLYRRTKTGYCIWLREVVCIHAIKCVVGEKFFVWGVDLENCTTVTNDNHLQSIAQGEGVDSWDELWTLISRMYEANNSVDGYLYTWEPNANE